MMWPEIVQGSKIKTFQSNFGPYLNFGSLLSTNNDAKNYPFIRWKIYLKTNLFYRFTENAHL